MIHKVLKDLGYDESNYKRKYVALSSFTEKKSEIPQTNYQIFNSKALENKTKSLIKKYTRIINIGVRIKEIETTETIQVISKKKKEKEIDYFL